MAPGPKRFTVHFFQVNWEIIRADLMRAFNAFWHLDMRSFHSINKSLLVLLPKMEEAGSMRDYMPIFLIHSVGKLFTNILACRLAPRLRELVHPCQSTFAKGRSIHDNFRLVQSSTQILHVERIPSLLIKVDLHPRFQLGHLAFLSLHPPAHGLLLDMA
jgi:hypothetical protein